MNPKIPSQPLGARHSLMVTALSAGLFLSQSLFADNITLTATNGAGASSFGSALSWSNAEAPSAAHDYFVNSGSALRTVADSGSATFAGNSLTLGNGATAGILIFKNQATGSVITVNDLTLNNGEIQAGGTNAGAGHIVTLAGNGIHLAGLSNRINNGAADRHIIVAAPVSGDGGLVKNAGGYAKLAGANSYTGGTTINAGVLHFSGPAPTAGVITVNNNTTLVVPVGGGAAGDYTTGLTGAGSIGGLLHEGLGAGASNVTLTTGIGIGIDTGRAGGTQTYAGEWDSPLLKLGEGILALSGGGVYPAGGGAGFPFIVRQGELHLTGGTHAVGGELVVGGNFGTLPGAEGYPAKLQVDAGRLEVSSWLSVGRGNGTGSVSSGLVINNDAVVTAGNFSAGFDGGSALNTPGGSIVVNDDASLIVAGTSHIAESAGSNFTVTINDNASFNRTGANTTNVGGGANAVGEIKVNGGSASFEGDLVIGVNGTGRLVLDGGDVSVASATTRWLRVGNQNAGSGQIEINGGTLTLNAGTDIRFSPEGTSTGASSIALNGGEIIGVNGANDSEIYLQQGANAGSNNTFNLNGGTLAIARILSGNGTNTAAFNFNGGTLRASTNATNFVSFSGANQRAYVKNGGAVIDTNGFAVTIPQALEADGTGGLRKTGAGKLVLGGVNTYTGETAVEEGALEIAVSGSVVSDIVVEEDAVIGGSGEVSGSLTLNPGALFSASVGSPLHVEGGVAFAGPSALVFDNAPTNGNYTLFTYGAGGVSDLGNLTSSYRTVITDDPANSQVVGTVSIGNLTWNSTDGIWELGTGGWAGGFTDYFDGDTVTFGERPGPSVIELKGLLLPAGITVENSTNPYTFSGPGSIAGGAWLDKTGAGALTIATANSYTGGTFLIGGTLNINHPSALGSGQLTIEGGVIDNTSGGPIVMTGNFTQAWYAGGITFTGSDSLDMGAGGVIITNQDEPEEPSTVTVGGNTLAVGEIKASNGLIKEGPGRLEVAGVGVGADSSVVTGTLEVVEGELRINRTDAAAAASGDFTANGLTGSGTLTNGAAVERWFFNAPSSGGSFEFTGTLADGGVGGLGFNLNGAGAQTLSGDNSYTGATTVGGGGTLTIAGANTGAGTSATVNSGTLILAHPGALGENSTIRFAGDNLSTLVLATDEDRENPYGFVFGTTTNATIVANRATPGEGINHTLTVVGTNGLGGGTLTVASGGNVTSGAGRITFPSFGLSAGSVQTTTLNPTSANVTLGNVSKVANAPEQTLGLGGATQDNRVTGVISNGTSTISVLKSGAGTWTLSGNNTYTGPTSVNAGALIVTGDNSGATGALAVLGGATLGGNGDLGGSVTINDGGIHALTVAATPGGQETRHVGGSLNHVSGSVLTLTAASQPAEGVYTLVSTGGGLTFSSGTTINLVGIDDGVVSVSGNNLVLTVGEGGSGSGFSAWASHPGIGLTPGVNDGFSHNPDNDGFDNGIEYILGGHPVDGANNPKVYSLIADSSDAGAERELILTIAVPQGTPAFPEGTPASSVTFEGFGITVRGSTNLADFNETVKPVTTILPDGVAGNTFVQGGVTYQYRSFSLESSNGLPGKGFLQVVVTNP